MEPLLEEDDAAWDALCEERGEFLQTSAFTDASRVFGSSVRRIRISDETGAPIAALALLLSGFRHGPALDKVLGRRIDVSGGPLVLRPGGLAPGDGAHLLDALVASAEELGAVETRWKPSWPALAAALPFAEAGFDATTIGVAWRELPEHPGEVAATLSRVHRKAVRRAEKEGVRVREARGFAEIVALVDASFLRSGKEPRNRAFLEELHAGLERRGRAIGLVADDDSGTIAALLAARCGDAVFNLFHGRGDGDSKGASNLLHLRLFERAVELGARRIHTGDASLAEGEDDVAGITRFKRHLGFRIEPGASASVVHRPGARRVRGAALSVYRLLKGTR